MRVDREVKQKDKLGKFGKKNMLTPNTYACIQHKYFMTQSESFNFPLAKAYKHNKGPGRSFGVWTRPRPYCFVVVLPAALFCFFKLQP